MVIIKQSCRGSTISYDEEGTNTKVPTAITQGNLDNVISPHEAYEGYHRFDPAATWTVQEERKVVFKTDLMLLSFICLMV